MTIYLISITNEDGDIVFEDSQIETDPRLSVDTERVRERIEEITERYQTVGYKVYIEILEPKTADTLDEALEVFLLQQGYMENDGYLVDGD